MSLLDFWCSFSSHFTLSQTLYFALCFTGELVHVFHSGLATLGCTNGTGSYYSGAVATMTSSYHGRNIFYFNAPLLLLVLLCSTDKEQEKLDIESVHHSNIGLKKIARGSFRVIFKISTHRFGEATLWGVAI